VILIRDAPYFCLNLPCDKFVHGPSQSFLGVTAHGKVKIATNRRTSRNNDALSSWLCVLIISMTFSAVTALLEH